jgi:hypothetical protein
MSDHHRHENFPDHVIIDGDILKDLCWLLTSLEDFARGGDLPAVYELVRFADDRLSADGLAAIAGEYTRRLRRRTETAP